MPVDDLNETLERIEWFARVYRKIGGETDTHKRITALLDDFRIYDGTYKRHSVSRALELQAEITPYLIALLDDMVDKYPDYLDQPELMIHDYALQLLGHFRETRAHATIVRLMRLPGPVLEQLLGDIWTEDMSRLLFMTCGGNLDLIKDLVTDKHAHEYSRNAAAEALVYAVVLDGYDRSEIMQFVKGLFTGREAELGSDFWGNLACCACDLHPGELMDEIRTSYKEGLIYPGYVNLKEVECEYQREKEEVLLAIRDVYQGNIHDDVHDYMSWWACFHPDPQAVSNGLREKKEQEEKKRKKQKKKVARKQRVESKKRKKKRKKK